VVDYFSTEKTMPNEIYATVGWTVDDVQALFDVTEDEAREFFDRHGPEIISGLSSKGWDILTALGQMDHLTPVKE